MRKENIILSIISIILFIIISCKVIYDTSWKREIERQEPQETQAQEVENGQYTKQAKVEIIDKEKDIIIFIDENNEYNSIEYEEGFSVGQLIIITFDDNGTEEKFDDKIINFFSKTY